MARKKRAVSQRLLLLISMRCRRMKRLKLALQQRREANALQTLDGEEKQRTDKENVDDRGNKGAQTQEGLDCGDIPGTKANNVTTEIVGRRIVDINYFMQQLFRVVEHVKFKGCSLSSLKVIKESRFGLLCRYTFRCLECQTHHFADTEPLGRTDTTSINFAAAQGIMASGGGFSQMEEILSTMNIPCMAQQTYKKQHDRIADIWKMEAFDQMEKAAQIEKEIAVAVGDLDENGIPCITVIVDGAWSKRSYRTKYNALSGAAAIVGYRSGKVLFLGVRNKYCALCERFQSKRSEFREHHCAKNWAGASTAMESDIILEGFLNSMAMYGIKYTRLIGDGDSNTYKKILDAKPYGNNQKIEKIECRNHLLRNYLNRLASDVCASKGKNRSTAASRSYVKKQLLRLRAAVMGAVAYRSQEEGPLEERIEKLKQDIINGPRHVFGDHKSCSSYFCSGQSEGIVNMMPQLVKDGVFADVLKALNSVINNARSLIHNCDSNRVEQLNAIIAKFVGGKRVNFSLTNSYEARCYGAAISFNSKTIHTATHKRAVTGANPSFFLERMEQRRLRKIEAGNRSQMKKRKKAAIMSEKRKVLQYYAADKSYGPHAEKPEDSENDEQTRLLVSESVRRAVAESGGVVENGNDQTQQNSKKRKRKGKNNTQEKSNQDNDNKEQGKETQKSQGNTPTTSSLANLLSAPASSAKKPRRSQKDVTDTSLLVLQSVRQAVAESLSRVQVFNTNFTADIQNPGMTQASQNNRQIAPNPGNPPYYNFQSNRPMMPTAPTGIQHQAPAPFGVVNGPDRPRLPIRTYSRSSAFRNVVPLQHYGPDSNGLMSSNWQYGSDANQSIIPDQNYDEVNRPVIPNQQPGLDVNRPYLPPQNQGPNNNGPYFTPQNHGPDANRNFVPYQNHDPNTCNPFLPSQNQGTNGNRNFMPFQNQGPDPNRNFMPYQNQGPVGQNPMLPNQAYGPNINGPGPMVPPNPYYHPGVNGSMRSGQPHIPENHQPMETNQNCPPTGNRTAEHQHYGNRTGEPKQHHNAESSGTVMCEQNAIPNGNNNNRNLGHEQMHTPEGNNTTRPEQHCSPDVNRVSGSEQHATTNSNHNEQPSDSVTNGNRRPEQRCTSDSNRPSEQETRCSDSRRNTIDSQDSGLGTNGSMMTNQYSSSNFSGPMTSSHYHSPTSNGSMVPGEYYRPVGQKPNSTGGPEQSHENGPDIAHLLRPTVLLQEFDIPSNYNNGNFWHRGPIPAHNSNMVPVQHFPPSTTAPSATGEPGHLPQSNGFFLPPPPPHVIQMQGSNNGKGNPNNGGMVPSGRTTVQPPHNMQSWNGFSR